MRRIFGRRPTRFVRGDAVRLKTALPNDGLEKGMVGTISEVRRTKLPSYDVQFISANGVVGRFAVDESDLMPADGRRFDDNDVVKLRRDVPSEGLRSGTVGLVSEVSAGPPLRYAVEFVDANGATIARTALFDEDLVSPEEPTGPSAAPSGAGGAYDETAEETGLADDQLDELIAELRSQGQAMQREQQVAREEGAAQEQQAQPEPPEPAAEAEAPPSPPVEEPAQSEPSPPVEESEPAAVADDAPPSDGRATKFVRDDMVKLNASLPSTGYAAGTAGRVIWVTLGSPVTYLVEFQVEGSAAPLTKVEESYLSFDR